MDRTRLIKRIPLFDCLSQQELEELADLFEEASFLKGERVCRVGEKGDTFFVVLSGEMEVWGGRAGERRIINRLGPGEFFGEIVLFTGGKRTATVTVAMDAKLLRLDRRSFEAFFLQRPKALAHLSKVMAQRLVSASRGDVKPRATTVVGIAGSSAVKGKTLTALVLTGLLEDLSRKQALHVTFHSLNRQRAIPEKLPLFSKICKGPRGAIRKHIRKPIGSPAMLKVGVDEGRARDRIRESLGGLLDILKDLFSYIVLDVSTDSEGLISSVVGASDFVVCLEGSESLDMKGKAGSATRVFKLINRFNEGSRTIPINHMEPFVLPVEPALLGLDSVAQSRFIRNHPRAPIARPLHRLARKILGITVGLALGGGGAFGIAHVGVLRVLEENDIPVDLVAGTSIGSIIALGYASGMSASEMVEVAKGMGGRWRAIFALTISLYQPGYLRGNPLLRLLAPLRADGVSTFDQLHLPCRTVAADIETGERVTIQSGPLEMAFRASCAVPLLVSPVFYQGRAMVDGGMVDPVPAEVVKEMGADVCIAVNVVPPLKKGVETILSRTYRQVHQLNPLSYVSSKSNLPNRFDLVMNSLQVLQYELGNFKAISADVRINPDLSWYTWIEVYKPMPFIEKGIQAAEQVLPEITRVISERLSGVYGV